MGLKKLLPVGRGCVDHGTGVVGKVAGEVVEPFQVARTMAIGS
jgi:hypothetical protein